MVHAIRPFNCNATRFHCLLVVTCIRTQINPMMNKTGSTVHWPAIKKPVPIYPILLAILSRGVRRLSLTIILSILLVQVRSQDLQVFFLVPSFFFLYLKSGLVYLQTLHFFIYPILPNIQLAILPQMSNVITPIIVQV